MNAHHHTHESCSRTAHDHPTGFGRHSFRPPFGMAGHAHGFGGPGGQRARRGDVRAAVLRLLSEKPMHGYQIIQELSQRSGGAWNPSAGSVYPTLQLLADEGLVSAEESGGKKVFSLTETGAAEVAKTADQSAPWEEAAKGFSGGSGYHEAVGRLMQAVFQIGRSGSAPQVAAAVEVLNDARKRLYAILAED